MTSVDFHLLENANADAMRYAASLCLQAYRRHRPVHIHADAAELLPALSDTLWAYSQTSFIAHDLDNTGLVSLSSGAVEPETHDCLILLGSEIPVYFSRFEQLLVVVAQDEASKAVARENFRFFKQRGYPLQYVPVKHNNF